MYNAELKEFTKKTDVLKADIQSYIDKEKKDVSQDERFIKSLKNTMLSADKLTDLFSKLCGCMIEFIEVAGAEKRKIGFSKSIMVAKFKEILNQATIFLPDKELEKVNGLYLKLYDVIDEYSDTKLDSFQKNKFSESLVKLNEKIKRFEKNEVDKIVPLNHFKNQSDAIRFLRKGRISLKRSILFENDNDKREAAVLHHGSENSNYLQLYIKTPDITDPYLNDNQKEIIRNTIKHVNDRLCLYLDSTYINGSSSSINALRTLSEEISSQTISTEDVYELFLEKIKKFKSLINVQNF